QRVTRAVGTRPPVFRFAVQWTEPWSRTGAGEPVVEQVGVYLTREAALDAFGEQLRQHQGTVLDGWRLRVVDLADRAAPTGTAAAVGLGAADPVDASGVDR